MKPASLSASLASLLLTPLAFAQEPASGWLGVYIGDNREAVVVTEVIPDSPADRAGLEPGDEVLRVEEKDVSTQEQLVEAIRKHRPGERIRIELRRDGKKSTVTVEIGTRPEQIGGGEARGRAETPAPSGETAPVEAMPERRAYLGLRVRKTDEGVVVEEALAKGPAAGAGIRPGERITRIAGHDVRDLPDLDAALQHARPGEKVELGLRSQAGARSVTITLGELPGQPQRQRQGDRRAPRAEPPAVEPERRAQPGYDVEREIEELRRDLHELRRQLDELRRQRRGGGRGE